jgi:4-amino-4-deoxy-L-arabinose transferase-like glycosyltransferase
MNDRNKLLSIQLVVVVGVSLFFFFFGLGAFGLLGADEPRYAQIAHEMLARHNWIVPTFNGNPWLEKPVLLYWKMMSSYMVFGVSDWVARVPAAAYATVLVLAVFFFMRHFRFTSELDAAMITASSAGMIGFGRGASTDMLVSAPFALAMMSWWTWHQTGKKLWLGLFYAMLGVGALAKGPVAPALAVLVVGAYAVVHRDGKIFVRSMWVPGFALFFVIALPWYLAVQHYVPQFFRVFFIEHNLERFGTNLYQHSQPFWYYIPVFLLATLPWTVFTIPALIEAGKTAMNHLRLKSEQDSPAAHNFATHDSAANNDSASHVSAKNHDSVKSKDWLAIFLFIWTIIPIVFFSISRSKLPGYILPAIPAAALLTAEYLHRAQTISRLKIALHALVCAILLVGALIAPFAMVKQSPHLALQVGMMITGAVIAIMVLLMVRREGVRVLHFVTLVPTILAVAFLLRPAAPIIDNTQSARPISDRLTALGAGNNPIAVFNVKRQISYGLTFYRNQPIPHYEHEGPVDLPSGIPSAVHVVVAKEGSLGAVQAAVGDRTVTSLGTFPAQHLEFFMVSAAK